MNKLTTEKYQKHLTKAVKQFWLTRKNQAKSKKKIDQGNRSSVTGGKQLDGFIDLIVKVAVDLGVPKDCIYTKGNILPGFFRPSKDWDLLIISPKKQLIAVIELKSQVGSFGNNFNNRTEEALGSAIDLWTAFREESFPQTQQPWLGYALIVQKSNKSTSEVRLLEPHYKARFEFQNTSYLDRYVLFCKKLMVERHYTATALLSTTEKMDFEFPDNEISFDTFLLSFMGFIQGKLNDFSE